MKEIQPAGATDFDFEDAQRVIDALLDGRAIPPEEVSRFERMALDSMEVRLRYLHAVHLHCAIVPHVMPLDLRIGDEDEQARGLGDSMILPAVREYPERQKSLREYPGSPGPVDPGEKLGAISPNPAFFRRSIGQLKGWRWAAVAALLIGLVTAVAFSLYRRSETGVGRLIASSDTRWDSAEAPAPGSILHTGMLALAHGDVRIRFANGADVFIHGPARFSLLSAKSAELLTGKLSATVEGTAVGFCVVTPAARITDLGTEFGVMVDPSGATETHVLRGQVSIELTDGAHGSSFELSADQAALVKPGDNLVNIPARPEEFRHAFSPIDLADIVAGGDGTGCARMRGVDPLTGRVTYGEPLASEYHERSDGAFHPVAELPMVAGVFIPEGAGKEVVLDPGGHTFNRFPDLDGRSFHWIWAGGAIPLAGDHSDHPPNPAAIGGKDFNTDGHGLLFMHASKGITFDLAAIRRAHPSRSWSEFRAACQNTKSQIAAHQNVSETSALWVFVDGQLRFSRFPLLITDPAFDVNVALTPEDRYLTVVTTDGGDGFAGDWITLGDPRLQ